MSISPQLLMFVLALFVWVVGGLIWAVRLEGRLRLLERLVEDEIAASRNASAMILGKLAAIEATLTKIQVSCAAFNHVPPGMGR